MVIHFSIMTTIDKVKHGLVKIDPALPEPLALWQSAIFVNMAMHAWTDINTISRRGY